MSLRFSDISFRKLVSRLVSTKDFEGADVTKFSDITFCKLVSRLVSAKDFEGADVKADDPCFFSVVE